MSWMIRAEKARVSSADKYGLLYRKSGVQIVYREFSATTYYGYGNEYAVKQ